MANAYLLNIIIIQQNYIGSAQKDILGGLLLQVLLQVLGATFVPVKEWEFLNV